MSEYLKIEVTLRGVDPRISREFLLRASATFDDLHDAIQDAAPWEDRHLHSFESTDGKRVFASNVEGSSEWPQSEVVALGEYLRRPGDRCLYCYDFADNWEHDVVVTDVVDKEPSLFRELTGGAATFPPEDCGGVDGYRELLSAQESGLDRTGAWVDPNERWNPTPFDLARAKRRFDLSYSEEAILASIQSLYADHGRSISTSYATGSGK